MASTTQRKRSARSARSRRSPSGSAPRHRIRTAVRLVLPMVLLVATVSYASWRWLIEPTPQHVILIVVDTMRRDALGCYGNPRQPTPHMDRIAAEGVRFDTAISTSGWTLPAIGSLLTGAWPTIHGGHGKIVDLSPLREEIPTAPEVLQANGMRTLGVANAAFVSPLLGFSRGFDVFDHRHAFNQDIRRADETVDDALHMMRAQPEEPSFVFIHLFDPHLDYDPPPGYAFKYTDGRTAPTPPLSLQQCGVMGLATGTGRPTQEDADYVRGIYDAEMNFIDVQIGRLVDELKRMGIYDETLLVITSDHGEEFWEHQQFEHGHTLYDELVRIPLIVKPPSDFVPAQRVVSSQVRILDIPPTLFDFLHIDPPESFVGTSIVPLMLGKSEERRVAFSESTLYGADKLAWRDGRYKLIVDTNPQARVPIELYDLQEDPAEATNLIDTLPDVAAEYRAELTDFRERLLKQAKSMSNPKAKDMSPARVQSLMSLGYIR